MSVRVPIDELGKSTMFKTSGLVLALIATSPAIAQSDAEGKGKDLVAAKCNSCHVLEARVGGGYTDKGWKTVMRMMTNHGVPIAADELGAMTAYLAKSFPEKPKPAGVVVAGPDKVTMKSWQAATPGARPHDPLATADGALWYTGQMANVLGRIDPKTGKVREYKLTTAHSGPHGLVEDKGGNIWYTGNTGALIGKLDPKTAKVTEYKMPDPEVKDPHTLIFDQAGILWFTAQNSNRIGRLDPATGEIKLLTPPTAKSRPYGMAVNSKGTVFYVPFGIAVIDGNLAPEGCIIKASAADPKLMEHEGRAVVFENAADLAARIDLPDLDVRADDVLVLKNIGRKGAPGMPEAGYMPIQLKLAKAGVKDMVRISDGRMSGTAFGTIVLHVVPEAALGGPLAYVQNGDRIRLSVSKRQLLLLVPAEELARRAKASPVTIPTAGRGYRKLFLETVTQADQGVDFDFLRAEHMRATIPQQK